MPEKPLSTNNWRHSNWFEAEVRQYVWCISDAKERSTVQYVLKTESGKTGYKKCKPDFEKTL